MSTKIWRPGEKVAIPSTFIERGPRGGKVRNSRMVVIKKGDALLPPTQKPGHKWIQIQLNSPDKVLETSKVELYETFIKHTNKGEIKTLCFYLKVELYEALMKHFSKGEIKALCFYLDIDYELLEGKGKADKARELVLYFERHGRLIELKNEVSKQRPFISWLN